MASAVGSASIREGGVALRRLRAEESASQRLRDGEGR